MNEKQMALLFSIVLSIHIVIQLFFLFSIWYKPPVICQKTSTQAIQIKGNLVDVLICEDNIEIIKVY